MESTSPLFRLAASSCRSPGYSLRRYRPGRPASRRHSGLRPRWHPHRLSSSPVGIAHTQHAGERYSKPASSLVCRTLARCACSGPLPETGRTGKPGCGYQTPQLPASRPSTSNPAAGAASVSSDSVVLLRPHAHRYRVMVKVTSRLMSIAAWMEAVTLAWGAGLDLLLHLVHNPPEHPSAPLLRERSSSSAEVASSEAISSEAASLETLSSTSFTEQTRWK